MLWHELMSMARKCLFKFLYHCDDNGKLQVSQPDSNTIHDIIEASKLQGHFLHEERLTKCEHDKTFHAHYHKNCVSRYLLMAKHLSQKHSHEQIQQTTTPE